MPLVQLLKNSSGYRFPPPHPQPLPKKKQIPWKNVHLASQALLVL